MPKASPMYTSFNAGELSELMLGRTDLEQYSRGGLTFKNIMVLQYGPFLFRPGSMYSANTKVNSTISRILEFVFNPSDAFIIEMGVSYFRFFTSEGQVSGPLEVAHTYTAAELFDVHYSQSNDVISLAHGDHKPAELKRLSASSWSLSDIAFKANPYLDDNVDTSKTLNPSVTAIDATGTLVAVGHTPFTVDHVGSFWRVTAPTGSPEVQGYVEITAFNSSTSVNIKVIKTLAATGATDDWAEAAWSDERGWPHRVTYHENRLWFCKTDTQPNGAWGSQPFIYDNFNPGVGLDNDAISEQIPSASDIKWISGGRTLIAGTDKGDFNANGAPDVGLTPTTTKFTQQTGWESEDIQPKIIGNYVYPVQAKGRKLREVFYSFNEDSYKSSDATAVAEHITKSGIKDIAYQRNPYSILYCVLNNGKMAIMTRESDQLVLGWAILDTDGEYESVGVIPHPTKDHDIVFTIVKRTINGSVERHMEFFESPEIPDRQDFCFYVDDGLRFDAYESNVGGTLTLSAVTGDGITVTAGSAVFVSGDVGQRIRVVDSEGTTILGELKITQFNSTTEVLGDVVFDFSTTSYAANEWGISVNLISGLDHLEAKTVKILVDGGTHDDKTVSSGDITLNDGEDGFVVAIGLGYVGRWKNMPIDTGSATGTAIGKKKRIYRAGFVFFRSLGMEVGGDEDHLNGLIFRNPATFLGQVEAFFTGQFSGAKIDTTNDYEGHIVIQQDNPLPLCVLAVIPHVETYDV